MGVGEWGTYEENVEDCKSFCYSLQHPCLVKKLGGGEKKG